MLIVDDDLMNIEVHSAMLEHRHIKSDSALNGSLAIKKIQERIELVYRGEASMYMIVLIDYSMPEMDGPQVAIAIHKLF